MDEDRGVVYYNRLNTRIFTHNYNNLITKSDEILISCTADQTLQHFYNRMIIFIYILYTSDGILANSLLASKINRRSHNFDNYSDKTTKYSLN